jgi:histone H3
VQRLTTPRRPSKAIDNSASVELPRSSKHNHGKSSEIVVSSGSGKGKGKLSARKNVIRTGKRFKPGTLALKEIKRL